jgi:hypothetical protein
MIKKIKNSLDIILNIWHTLIMEVFMEPEKKPPETDGLFWKILAVIGTAASIASLALTIYKMVN